MPSGVLKEITAEDRSYYMASDIMALLGISKSKAYDVIRTMRKECIDAGKLTKAYPAGRIIFLHFVSEKLREIRGYDAIGSEYFAAGFIAFFVFLLFEKVGEWLWTRRQ